MAKEIYDCFIFFNELDVLRLRLEELYDEVDHFVLCEATVTFRGEGKPLHFLQNRHLFDRYRDKIIHVVVEDMPHPGLRFGDTNDEKLVWDREHFQRNALRRGLGDAGGSDVIIISDVDEIPAPATIRFLRENYGYFLLDMRMYQFHLNMLAQESGWLKVFAYSQALSDTISDYNVYRTVGTAAFDRIPAASFHVRNAGWHFTFLGGQLQVSQKLAAYSHVDGWQRTMWDERNLAQQMRSLRDVGGGQMLRFCDIDDSFPQAVRDNLARYVEIGFIKQAAERARELEQLWWDVDTRLRTVLAEQRRTRRVLGRLRKVAGAITHLLSDEGGILLAADFSTGWYAGEQRRAPERHADPAIPEWRPGHAVMCHCRDAKSETSDTNVGHFTVDLEDVQDELTASCRIWIPLDFAGQRVELSLGEWPRQSRHAADLAKRGLWQQITASARPQESSGTCHIVLRVQSDIPCILYSTGWQITEGQPVANP